jgi:hypothetical protein
MSAAIDTDDMNCEFVFACRHNDVERAKILLSQGADINFRFSFDNLTALHCAAKKGHNEIVKFLLKHGNLDIHAISEKKKQTALHMACRNNYTEIALMIINDARSIYERDNPEKQCLLEFRDYQNRLALHSACLHKNETLFKALMEYPVYCDFDFEINDLLGLAGGNKVIRNEIFKYFEEE